MRLASQGAVRHAAEAFAIQETIDPIDLAVGCLLDDAERASCVVGGGLVNDTELHGRAPSSRDWNWCASPPWTKKLFGSWPSGSETRRVDMPRSRRLREISLVRSGLRMEQGCPLVTRTEHGFRKWWRRCGLNGTLAYRSTN